MDLHINDIVNVQNETHDNGPVIFSKKKVYVIDSTFADILHKEMEDNVNEV